MRLLALILALTLSCTDAFSQSLYSSTKIVVAHKSKNLPQTYQLLPVVGHINEKSELQSLIRTDRLPRSWRTAWVVPGKVYRWYYAWVMPDGSTVTKVESAALVKVQDDRPLNQSHPNLYLCVILGSTCGGALASGAVSLIHL